MGILDFMHFLSESCNDPRDESVCEHVLRLMTLTDGERQYCRDALYRRLRWIRRDNHMEKRTFREDALSPRLQRRHIQTCTRLVDRGSWRTGHYPVL
jgi:hypothetical protein